MHYIGLELHLHDNQCGKRAIQAFPGVADVADANHGTIKTEAGALVALASMIARQFGHVDRHSLARRSSGRPQMVTGAHD